MALVEMSGREIEVVRQALGALCENMAYDTFGAGYIAWDLEWRLASAK